MDSQGEFRPGDLFAGHRIEGVAGRGGMGVVYLATALDLDRPVALKLIAPALSSDVSFRERFIRETRVAASLDHPNVIPVFAAGEEGGRLFFSMRHVDGDDLRTLIRREGRLAPARAAQVVAQVGSALDAAHARGIVHRDVKPANVLLGTGEHAYLTDFGLTKRVHSVAGGETRPGGWVGTLGYVAPEQIRGERVDARADVYALGCILFHALTGATPYARESDEATLWAHLNDPPPALAPRAPGVPAAFEAIIARALAKEPDARFPSAGDLGRAALAAAGAAPSPGSERVVAVGAAAPDPETVASPPVGGPAPITGPTRSAAPTRLAAPAPRPRRRRLALGLLAGAVLLAGAGAAVGLGLGGDGEEPVAPPPPTSKAAARPAVPRVAGELVATIPVGTRPNALVLARDRLWVASQGETRLRLIDTASNEPVRSSPKVGVGAAALDAGFGSVWIAKATTQTLLRYSSDTARRVGAPIPLPPGTAVSVAVDRRAVWVGSRSGRDGLEPQAVSRVDPGSAALARAPLPQADGVQDLATGDGAVWVLGRRRAVLTRVDVASGATERITLSGDPQRIAVGQGAVWISNDDGSVSRIALDARRSIRRIAVGREPRGIAVARGAVWVANSLDGTATRIDPKSGKVVGEPVEVGGNPSAVAVRNGTAWFSLLADNAVARVRFR